MQTGECITYERLSILWKFLRDSYGNVFQIHLTSCSLCLLSECMNTYVKVKLPMLNPTTTDQPSDIFEFDSSILWTLIEAKLKCFQVSSSLMFKIEQIKDQRYLGVANWPENDTEVKVLLKPGNASRILNIDESPALRSSHQFLIGPVSSRELCEWVSYGFEPATTFVDLIISGKSEVTIISHQNNIGTYIVKKRKTDIFDNNPSLSERSLQHFDSTPMSITAVTQCCRLVSFDAKQIKILLELFPECLCVLKCNVGEPLQLTLDADITMIVVPHEEI